jgi:hypothetical protein
LCSQAEQVCVKQYELPPSATIVTELPAQADGVALLNEAAGSGWTVTEAEAV